MLQTSMDARAVDVLCLGMGQSFPPKHNERVVSEFAAELDTHVEECGLAIESFSIHPVEQIIDIIHRHMERKQAIAQRSSGAAGRDVLLAATGPQAKGMGVGPKVQGPKVQEPRAQ